MVCVLGQSSVYCTPLCPNTNIFSVLGTLLFLQCSGADWPHNTCFVGNDYFCDSGSHLGTYTTRYFTTNSLWDGAGCGVNNTCCQFNNPPWFLKTLTDDPHHWWPGYATRIGHIFIRRHTYSSDRTLHTVASETCYVCKIHGIVSTHVSYIIIIASLLFVQTLTTKAITGQLSGQQYHKGSNICTQ